jgi:hypothetical protein
MDSQKQQAAERIKEANNILVTVSSNPSVDQLAACIGLTLTLNKMGKHATAVFSGAVPSTIEFLQPEKTIEKNTDSLRDFIIALDKSKADKLRYKVEDRVVKIFITPYRTSINEKDLEFSQGDFNVDVVIALGVHSQADLDQAITSHGRILHDATVITVNVKPGGELGGINWLDPTASSLSELGVQLIDILDKKLIDTQIATALLTGIVAETDRFSNAKTSPQTMSTSAELMGAGANQQLVATKLQEPVAPPPPPPPPAAPIANQQTPQGDEQAPAKKTDDGTLEITHDETPQAEKEAPKDDAPSDEESKPADEPKKPTEEPEAKPAAEDTEATKESEPAPQEQKPEEQESKKDTPAKSDELQLEEAKQLEPKENSQPDEQKAEEPESALQAPQIHIDEHGALQPLDADAALLPPKALEAPEISHHDEPPKMIIQPTARPDEAPALTLPDAPAPGSDEPPAIIKHPAPMPVSDSSPVTKSPVTEGDNELPSGAARADSFLVGGQPVIVPPTAQAPEQKQDESPKPEEKPAKPEETQPEASKTLSDLERDVHSSHIDAPSASVQDAGSPAATGPFSNSLPPLQPPANPPVSSAPAAGNNPMFADDILSSLGIPSDTGGAPSGPSFGGGNAQPNSAALPPLDNAPGSMNGPAMPPSLPIVDVPAAAPAEQHPSVDSARDAVAQAISGTTPQLEPVQALNAQPVDLALPGTQPAPVIDAMSMPPAIQPTLPDVGGSVVSGPQMGMPDLTLPGMQMPQANPNPDEPTDPNAPPPVPPPMMPPANPF